MWECTKEFIPARSHARYVVAGVVVERAPHPRWVPRLPSIASIFRRFSVIFHRLSVYFPRMSTAMSRECPGNVPSMCVDVGGVC